MRAGSLALALALTGCGFHLAGSRPLPEPLRDVYVEVVQPYKVTEPPVANALRSRILRRGGSVAGEPADARTTLRLSGLEEKRDVLSIGPDGKALEFLLTTSVNFELTAGDKVIAPPDTLSASRDYRFNVQQVLATEAQEARLREYLQSELAELILLRLEARLANAPAASEPAVPATPAPANLPPQPTPMPHS